VKQRKERKTFKLSLTLLELTHLRDLCSILLPPEMKLTVSQALAALEDRSYVEARFWNKLVSVCKEAGVVLDDDAPDFVCASSQPPPVGVFKLMSDPDECCGEEPQSNVLDDLAAGAQKDDEKQQ